VVLAQDEARSLGHDRLGTEHLLLGLLREGEGLAARALAALDVSIDEARAQVVRLVGRGADRNVSRGQIPFTPRAKQALELGLREALTLGHDYIGTEHLLLGLVRSEGTGARALWELGVGRENVRDAVLALLADEPVTRSERRGREPSREESAAHALAIPSTRYGGPTPALVAGIWWAIGLAAGVLVGWAIWG
jgi:ATP-dependent Clp protease ATP-binding subunit ClpC